MVRAAGQKGRLVAAGRRPHGSFAQSHSLVGGPHSTEDNTPRLPRSQVVKAVR